jgi:alpha-1,6-mannosyltransferase
VLAPNQELAGVLAAKGRTDAHVMGTLAPKLFVESRPAAPPSAVRSVTFIGRLAPEKRIEQVLHAAQAFPKLRFRIVGDGPLRGLVDRFAADTPNLSATTWLDRVGVMSVIDDTDLVVLPSRHETFGTAAFESMVRGRLTLVSPECGITEWAKLSDGLFVMQPDESLTTALGRVLELKDETLRQTAISARHAALEVHREAVSGWLDLIGTLARDPAS